ncbi:unnamed protein product [Ranitomeya imitator]|uniref:Cadherin domain-containing protein n=1 Tax=Ranitomeya imitator TaxID=111125 RepID=A0ABN9L425_9NEOB|nr:unnamed protein product [Ranitomeya imitator]
MPGSTPKMEHTNSPTHEDGISLDLVFSRLCSVDDFTNSPLPLSDHNLLSFSIKNCHPAQVTPTFHTYRNIQAINTQKLMKNLQSSLAPIFSISCPDSALKHYNETLQSALDEAAPPIHKTTQYRRQQPWHTLQTRFLQQCSRCTERLWRKSNLPEDFIHYKFMLKTYNSALHLSKQTYFNTLITSLSNNPKRLFDTFQSLLNPREQAPTTDLRADDLANYFKEKIDHIRQEIISQSLHSIHCPPSPTASSSLSDFEPVTEEEVIASLGEQPKRAVQKRVERDVGNADSFRPLRRSKRRWVLTTIVLEENDPGPFPKYAGDLFNDRAENISVKYLISGPGVDEPPEEHLFQINDHTGQVFVNRPIDREKTPLFVIRFDAAERATGKIVDKSLIFNVEVKDANDNAPVFDKNTYDVPVKETVNLDNPVFQVTAIDHDKEDTRNSKVSYYLVNQIPDLPNVKFSVDPVNGLIRGKGCLNYEAANIIRLIVGARDSGTEPLASTTTVILRLEDGNNNMPVIIGNKFEVSVPEGVVKNDIFRLKVEDKDTPKTPAWRAKYKILSGNENQNYNLTTDPETNEGILSIVSPLDFEGTPTKIVVISVENEEPFYTCKNGKLEIEKTVVRSSVNVSINVIDSNDAPIFSPTSKTIREKEGLKPGSVLGTFNATDPDKV